MTLFNIIRPIQQVSALLILVIVAGCSVVGDSQPTQFYVMSEADNTFLISKRVQISPALRLGVGPISIPGYANRAQIVTIGRGAQLKVSDLDHWAEPVQDNVERILVGNLSTLINPQQIYPYPVDFHPGANSLQMTVEIRDMIQTETGMIRLTASWNIKRMQDNELLLRETKAYQMQQKPDDYATLASSLSALFGYLAVDMMNSVAQYR